MNKITTTLLTIGLTGTALTGLVTAQESEFTASAGIDVNSAYIFRGGTVNDEVNINPTLEGSIGNFTVGTWGNFNTDSSQFDEVDYYVGYDLPLGDDAPVSVSLGYTEYTYPTATDSSTSVAADGTETTTTSGGLDADREVSISFGTDLPGSPSLGIFYGIEGPFLEDGLYLELGAGHSIPLNEENALDLGIAIGYEAGDNFAENGISHATLSAGTGVGPASIGLSYVIETDEDVLAVDEEFFITIGLAL